ncbi:hypothetical protein GCM10011418_46870 [Sphingobacterium alkalisoli]|uniref:hypothetical protein n=1 Tax=Sphingobacterium alkalisoli TaxID=1874115 RepID=UPI0016693557|nr:hypothetical protein [Sphingobacterium alkalisoli]GGH32979.1 hypothetical protein GCM10011418_46870 [Sphingobacterium alkalisoli]
MKLFTIIDMEVHASVFEGLFNTNTKRFPHNNMPYLERAVVDAQSKYRTKLVIIDGVYSQNSDLAKMDEIHQLCQLYHVSGGCKKNARIRTSLMATHTRENLDRGLNALEDIGKKIDLSKTR